MNAISKWLMALALLVGPAVASAALMPVNGGALINDPDANLTWVADANLLQTLATQSGNAAALVTAIINASGGVIYDTPNTLDTPPASGTYNLSSADFNTTTGQMDWWAAKAFVKYLNTIAYQGYTNWRLPTTVDSSSSYANGNSAPSQSSEMAQLFEVELGGNYTVAGLSPFTNVVLVGNPFYFSGTEYSLSPSTVWTFWLGSSSQTNFDKNNLEHALVVRSGLVTPLSLLTALPPEVAGIGPEGLEDKATAALNHINAACTSLANFVTQAQTQDGKKLTPQQATEFISNAGAIELALGCNSPPPD